MRLITFFLFILMGPLGFAQNGIPPQAGARGIAMGNSGVIFKDVYSLFSNQAGLAYLEEVSVVAFGERRFGTVGINGAAAGIAYPVANGTFGLQLQYFGIDLYNEQRIGLAYARKFIDQLSIGVQFDYLNTNITDFGNKGLLTFEIGMLAQITKELSLGIHLFSPMRVEIIEGENLPTLLKFGMGYQPSKKVLVTLEAEKDIDFDVVIKGGIEYYLHSAVALRIGAANNPTLVTFGAGFQINEGFNIDVASSYHQTLGFSPGFSLSYAFK